MAGSATQDPSEAGPPRQSSDALGVELSRPRPDRALLTVRGELDTLTAPDLDAALRELLATPSATPVVDLTGVTFLASSGLAVLIQAAQRAEQTARQVHLVVSTRAVVRPLEVTGSDQLFTLHRDVETALAD